MTQDKQGAPEGWAGTWIVDAIEDGLARMEREDGRT